MKELGELLGWVIAISYAGTMLNYILKFVNKRYSKKISGIKNGKETMKLLMKIFVQKHRYWGIVAIVALLMHFAVQFMSFGINVTGSIAALLMIIQIAVGIYGAYVNKKRAGSWFMMHRAISVMLVLTIAVHLILK